jgi:hypothetical protein
MFFLIVMGCNSVFFIVGQLNFHGVHVSFFYGLFHGRAHPVSVHNDVAVDVTRGPADSLDQRSSGSQETNFIRIQRWPPEDTSGISSPSRKRIDPHQYVKFAQAKVTDDLYPLDGFDLAVEVSDLEA